MPIRRTELIQVPLAFWLLFAGPANAQIQCPAQPEQASKDSKVAVKAAIGQLGPVKAGDFSTAVERTTLDLLGKLPQADKLYLEQMLFSAFCSSVRNDKKLSDSEKSRALRDYASEVRRTLALREGASTASPSVQPPSGDSSAQAGQKKATFTGNWVTEEISGDSVKYRYLIKLKEISGKRVLGSMQLYRKEENLPYGDIDVFIEGKVDGNSITVAYNTLRRPTPGTVFKIKESLYGEIQGNKINFVLQAEDTPPKEFVAKRIYNDPSADQKEE